MHLLVYVHILVAFHFSFCFNNLVFVVIFSVLFQLLAGSLWVGQYYQRLQYNVMSKDDRRNKWTSDGNASLGLSFWFVLLNNIRIIYFARETYTSDLSSATPRYQLNTIFFIFHCSLTICWAVPLSRHGRQRISVVPFSSWPPRPIHALNARFSNRLSVQPSRSFQSKP